MLFLLSLLLLFLSVSSVDVDVMMVGDGCSTAAAATAAVAEISHRKLLVSRSSRFFLCCFADVFTVATAVAVATYAFHQVI